MFLHDARGHGRSCGWLRLQHCGLHALAEDVAAMIARPSLPRGVPVFVLGVSVGGLVVCKSLLEVRQPRRIRGLILSSPYLISMNKDQTKPLLVQLLRFGSSLVCPWLKLPGKKAAQEASSAALYGPDPHAVLLAADPLVTPGFGPRFRQIDIPIAAARMTAAEYDLGGKLARLHGGMHLLLQHGTEDIATDPEGTKRLYEQAAAAAGGDALAQEGVATVRRSLPRHREVGESTLTIYDGFPHVMQMAREEVRGRVWDDTPRVAQGARGGARGTRGSRSTRRRRIRAAGRMSFFRRGLSRAHSTRVLGWGASPGAALTRARRGCGGRAGCPSA